MGKHHGLHDNDLDVIIKVDDISEVRYDPLRFSIVDAST